MCLAALVVGPVVRLAEGLVVRAAWAEPIHPGAGQPDRMPALVRRDWLRPALHLLHLLQRPRRPPQLPDQRRLLVAPRQKLVAPRLHSKRPTTYPHQSSASAC